MADTDRTDDLILPVEGDGASRRSFLKLAGFGVASAALAGCTRGPTRLVVPRPTGAEGVVPGRPYWIATTCGGCEAACGVLAKCRDGRPIKLEGNPQHGVSRGGLCAVGQASLLDLYDGRLVDGAQLRGSAVEWSALDDEMRTALTASRGRTRLLTRTLTSPSTRAWVARLEKQHGVRHVEWDPRSASALLDAHKACFGVRAVPQMRLERARVLVAFDADFLGTWLSPVELAKRYRAGRNPDGGAVSRHIQLESRLSLTGCAADERFAIAPWEQRAALSAICARLAEHAGRKPPFDLVPDAPRPDDLVRIADELWAARGGGAVLLCGSDDPGAQGLAAYANDLLGAYGDDGVLNLGARSGIRRGDDGALAQLVADMAAGEVDVLIVDGLDPLYELPGELGFRDAVTNVGLVVTTSAQPDELHSVADAVAPVPHALACWNDSQQTAGEYSLCQPTVPALRSARTLRASLAAWLGDSREDRELLRDHWRTEIAPRLARNVPFDAFFDRVLHDGFVASSGEGVLGVSLDAGALAELLRTAAPAAPAGDGLALVLHANVAVPEGRHAHNPWLQEVPDPLTTIVWDNAACLAPETAARLGVKPDDVVRVGPDLELPVRVVPGQDPRVVAVALGYGVSGTDRFSRIGPSWLEGRLTVQEGGTVGSRAAELLSFDADGLRWNGRAVDVVGTGESVEVAATQDHHRLEVPEHLAPKRGAVRDAVLITDLKTLQEDPAHALHRHHVPESTLWPDDHVTTGPRWGMAIDLAACNGCSGCVVACQAENNVPVVGKDEVRRHREMTWLRIDRYFVGHGDDLRTVHQPMMCQHCENAPCETVCPVLATVHSEDGLNQQVYNRCVGTRYCANNCPYKTRRFNWFEYERADELRNLALNPDVTVRSRGVMEKCSMCVQRIQEGKAESSRTGDPLADGAVKTACQQSCPADAIAFGDLNDPESSVAQLVRGPRAYTVLEELNVAPGVTYLADVRNAPKSAAEKSHG